MKKISDCLDKLKDEFSCKDVDNKYYQELISHIDSSYAVVVKNLGYSRGTLNVGVSSSSAFQEISQFHKYQWLESLNQKGIQLKEIKVTLLDNLGDQVA